jgi:hypothetical protein
VLPPLIRLVLRLRGTHECVKLPSQRVS